MDQMIYLDNAATTKCAPEAVKAMMPYFSEYYGNPSSVYELASMSKKAITESREQIAQALGDHCGKPSCGPDGDILYGRGIGVG